MSLKPLLAMAGLAVLAACAEPVPLTQDESGRAVISGPAAASMFIENCYNSPNGRAVRANRNFTQKAVGAEGISVMEGVTSAAHNTLSADFVSLQTGGCSLSFVGDKPAAQSAAEAAAVLQAALAPTNVGGRRGGGQVNMVVAKGNIIVGNGSSRNRNGFSIMFFGRN